MNGPERLTRWLLGHAQPKPYSLDIEHPAIDDIAWAADRIEMLESHIETWTSDYSSLAKKLDAAERRIAELQQWEPDLSLYGKGEPKTLEELKASHDRLIGKSLADAYYAGFAEMPPRIKQRVSLEMLREIFNRMVVPAIREVGSLSSSEGIK